MNTVAGLVSETPVERLRSILGPVGLVVELPGVEHDLVHDLGDLDWMRRGAGAARLEGARGRIRDMALVIRRIGVLAVPAGRESDRHTPATAAGLGWECLGVGSGARGTSEGALLHVGLAAEAETRGNTGSLSVTGITDKHAETLARVSAISLPSLLLSGQLTGLNAVTLAAAW